jgi:hypothetical protein
MRAVFTDNNAGAGRKVPGGLIIFWKVALFELFLAVACQFPQILLVLTVFSL